MSIRITILMFAFSSVALADGVSPYFKSFDQLLPLCQELFLPNSMAREPGFNRQRRLEELMGELKTRSTDFRSKDGLAFLDLWLQQDNDQVAKQCAKLLKEMASS